MLTQLKLLLLLGSVALVGAPSLQGDAIPGVSTVFLIMMENHDWSTIKGSDRCPYLNTKILPQAAYANQYYNPPDIHPSEPNYLWLVAGTNFGILDDHSPATNTKRTTNHLAWLMDRAGVNWKCYAEDISGKDIPLTNKGEYAVRHVPFLFFQNINTNLAYVTNHIRPYPELAADLAADRAPQFCFLTPNLTNDMHNLTDGSPSTRTQGDNWLKKQIPIIMNSAAYQRGGLIIITWDEGTGETSDGPIGLFLLSPRIRSKGYSNARHYDHSDTLRTVQDIFGLQPYLGAANKATGLDDFFKFLRVEVAGVDDAGRHFTLRDALIGRTYHLEARADLSGSVWSDVDTRVADAVSFPLLDPSPGEGHAFYRVREEP